MKSGALGFNLVVGGIKALEVGGTPGGGCPTGPLNLALKSLKFTCPPPPTRADPDR